MAETTTSSQAADAADKAAVAEAQAHATHDANAAIQGAAKWGDALNGAGKTVANTASSIGSGVGGFFDQFSKTMKEKVLVKRLAMRSAAWVPAALWAVF